MSNREAFEKVFLEECCLSTATKERVFETWANGRYKNPDVKYALIVWQASRKQLMKELSESEPVAWMYPSDLEKFETNETFAQAFSVCVGSPDELSVGLIARPAGEE